MASKKARAKAKALRLKRKVLTYGLLDAGHTPEAAKLLAEHRHPSKRRKRK